MPARARQNVSTRLMYWAFSAVATCTMTTRCKVKRKEKKIIIITKWFFFFFHKTRISSTTGRQLGERAGGAGGAATVLRCADRTRARIIARLVLTRRQLPHLRNLVYKCNDIAVMYSEWIFVLSYAYVRVTYTYICISLYLCAYHVFINIVHTSVRAYYHIVIYAPYINVGRTDVLQYNIASEVARRRTRQVANTARQTLCERMRTCTVRHAGVV